MSDGEDFGRRLEDSIGQALGDMLITKWVALVETIENDGTRALWVSASDGLQAWDTLGMLDYALTRERGSVAYDVAEDRRDE